MIPIVPLCLASLAPLLQERSVLATYDLRPALPAFDSEAGWKQPLVSSLAWAYGHLEAPGTSALELRGTATPDAILDLVTQLLGEELHYEDRQVALQGDDRLLVLAPADVQAKVAAVLSTLKEAFGSAASLRVDLFSFGEGGASAGALPERSLVSDEEAARLVEALAGRGATHVSHLLRLAPGRTAAVVERTTVPLLLDYDTEIAQASVVFDPVVREVHPGLSLLARGSALSGGLHFSLVLAHHELAQEVEERPLLVRGAVTGDERHGIHTVEAAKATQTAAVATHALAFTAFLPQGRALVWVAERELRGSSTREVVVLRRAGGRGQPWHAAEVPGTGRSLLVVDTGIFGARELSLELGELTQGRLHPHPFLIAAPGPEPTGFFFDWMKRRFSVWRRIGSFGVAVSDPAWEGAGAEELERLVGAVQPPTRMVELEVRTCDAQGAALRLRFAALAGTSAGLVLGRTDTAVVDYEVEVAQFAAAADPLVQPYFEGLALKLDLSATDGGASAEPIVLEVLGRLSALEGALETFSPKSPMHDRIQRPRLRSLQVDEQWSAAPAEGPVVLRAGSAPVRGVPSTSCLEIELRSGR